MISPVHRKRAFTTYVSVPGHLRSPLNRLVSITGLDGLGKSLVNGLREDLPGPILESFCFFFSGDRRGGTFCFSHFDFPPPKSTLVALSALVRCRLGD